METAALQVSINTQAARADLNALAKAFDRVEGSFNSLDREFASSANNIDKSANKAVKGFDKVARVAALLGKVKIGTQSVEAIKQFTTAIDQLGRARSISDAKIANLRKFMVLASAIRAPTGVNGLAHFMQVVGNVKAPSAGQITRLQDFFKAISAFRAPAGAGGLAQLFNTFGSLKVPTTAQITRLRELLTVLSQAKNVAGASAIARDLDQIAASAGRAGSAINNMPARMRGMGQAAGGAHQNVQKMSGGIHELNNRMSLGYQLGTAFTAMFSTFTLGTFFREIWKTNIEMAKLEKSMLFATGSMEGQHKAVGQALGMFQQLGMRIDVAADSYARFAISSTAAGFSIEQTQKVFASVGQALQVVGASGQQVEYAMYGLTQMMQKGKVSSEEFNRQIGEQLPGNAAIGARALSKLLGRQVSVAEFFDKMAKGQIQSATFAPAWADEMDKMYAPLRALVDLRPDVALNRLKNAFTLFAVEVGKSGFMSGMGAQFSKITGSLIQTSEDGSIKLTEAGEAMAKSWGQNLAKAVMQVGKVLSFAVDHIEEMMAVVKGLIGLRLAATFYSWGSAAKSGAAGMIDMAKSAATTRNVVTAQNAAAIAPVAASRTAAAVSTAAAVAPASNAPVYSGKGFGPPKAGAAGTGVAMQLRATTQAAKGMGAGVAASTATAARGMTVMSAASATLGGSIKGVGMAFNAMRGAMSLAMPILLAAGVALAAFGSKTTTVGQQTMTFNDIAVGAFKTMGDSITSWWNKSSKAFEGFNKDGKKSEMTAGEITVQILAGFITLGKGIFDIAKTIGEILGTVLGNALSGAVFGFEALKAAMKGDFTTAGKMLKASSEMTADSITALGSGITERFDYYLSGKAMGDNVGAITAHGVTGAENRARGDAAMNEMMERNTRVAEDAAARVAEQQKENERLEAEGRAQSALRAISAGPAGLVDDYATIMGRLNETMSGLTSATDKNTTATTAASASAGAGGSTGGTDALTLALGMMKAHEGFKSSAYWDVNAFRTGYGSDTITDPNSGRVSRVTRNTTGVTQEMAEADLKRRITTEFMPAARRGIGDSVFDGLSAAAQAALTSVAYNYGSIPNSVRRAAQGGDKNAIATAVQNLGSDNGGINRRRRAEEASAIRNGTGVGGASAGMTATEAENITAKGLTLRDTYEKLIGSNPVQAAASAYQRFLVDLTQFQESVKEIQEKGADVSSWMNKDAFNATEKKLRQEAEDALNPLGKMNRDDKRENDLVALRMSGARDAAGFEERVNQLREQGYEFESEAGKARLESERALYAETQKRSRLLKAQMDLIGEQNDIVVSRAARNGSAFEADMARRIAGSAGEGRTFDQARADAGPEGLALMEQAAREADSERVSAAMQAAQRGLAEMQATARLRGSERTRSDNYKAYLEELTGLTGRTTAELEAQSPQLAAYARQLSDMKTALENPPGFQRWIDGLTPLRDAMEDIKVSFAEGLSDSITNALMGEEVNWGDMAKNLRRQWTKAMVDNALGSMFQMGVNKANGGAIAGMPATGEAASGSGGGLFSKIGSLFGLGKGTPAEGASAEGGIVAAAAGAANPYTINASSVTVNAQSLTGGAGPGAMGQLANALTSATTGAGASAAAGGASGIAGLMGAGGGLLAGALNKTTGSWAQGDADGKENGGLLLSALNKTTGAWGQGDAEGKDSGGLLMSSLLGGGGSTSAGGGLLSSLLGGGSAMAANDNVAAAANGGGWLSKLGGFAKGNSGHLIGIGATLLDSLGVFGSKKKDEPWTPKTVNGLIGSMSTNTMTGTEIAAKSNPWADVLNMALQVGGSYFGAGNGGQAYGIGGDLRKFVGSFREGGIATSPVDWAAVPHYREGTGNTSGDGIPAMLHPNEAVIPLSRGRKIPIEGGLGESNTSVTNNSFTIVANDPNEFRSAQSSMQRKQNRAAERSRLRNLG